MRYKIEDFSYYISALYQIEQLSAESKSALVKALAKGLKDGNLSEFENSVRFVSFGVKSSLLDDLLELIKEGKDDEN